MNKNVKKENGEKKEKEKTPKTKKKGKKKKKNKEIEHLPAHPLSSITFGHLATCYYA